MIVVPWVTAQALRCQSCNVEAFVVCATSASARFCPYCGERADRAGWWIEAHRSLVLDGHSPDKKPDERCAFTRLGGADQCTLAAGHKGEHHSVLGDEAVVA